MPSALLILAGLAGLLLGADLLVRGGAALASNLGVRPIVIGLTVVALARVSQSWPLASTPWGRGARAWRVRFDLPAMTGACLALWLLALDGSLSRVDGTWSG